MWGSTGILRLFTGEVGGQIAWLLPAALVLMVVGLWLLRKLPRVDLRRAILLLFSAWLVITALAFSFMAGIFHAYYTVALAPALAAVAAIGATLLWAERARLWARVVAAAVVVGSAWWSWVLLAEAPTWLPWLKFLVAGLGVVAAVMLVLPPRAGLVGRRFNAATIAIALSATLLGPAAWTVDTILTPHSGSIVTAGPTVASGMGGPAGPGAGAPGGAGGPAGAPGGTGGIAGNAGGAPGQGAGQGTGNGGMGGLLGGGTVGTAVTKLLTTNATQYTWVAAAIGSQTAAGYQLASGESVMPIGGFNGSDPSPTLAEFQSYVKAGAIHYFIAGSAGAPNGGSTDSSSITAWVEANFTAQTVDGVTLYDLTSAI
jgi:4-amino-4-deoxy-L-arabinose transferase-like glycosyltransferase